jgi:protein-tyrosine phosphatase
MENVYCCSPVRLSFCVFFPAGTVIILLLLLYYYITKKKKTVEVSVSENDVCEIMVFVFSLFHLATVLFIKERYQELS